MVLHMLILIFPTLILQWKHFYYAKKTYQNKEGDDFDLDWDAAISFVSKCQNLSSTNKEKWVSSHKDDRGGFIYFPGKSMVKEILVVRINRLKVLWKYELRWAS